MCGGACGKVPAGDTHQSRDIIRFAFEIMFGKPIKKTWTVIGLLLTASVAFAEPAAEPTQRILVAPGQGYFPVAVRLKDGKIAVVLRGGGPHLSMNGRLDIVISSDEGKSWSKPAIVVDSPL